MIKGTSCERASGPLVSVVIPTFNNAAMVGKAVESALAQTYPNVEVIVVDDGSEDDTSGALSAYQGKIEYIRKPNGGAGSARNAGVRASSGEWVGFLDDDDLWLPERLARQMEAVRAYPECAGAFTDFEIVSDAGTHQYSMRENMRHVPSGWILDELFWHNFICTSTVVARRAVLEEMGGFEESLRRSQDWHLWMRMAARYQWVFVDEVLAIHRVRPGNLSSDIEGRLIACQAALEKIVAEFPHLRRSARRMRAKQHVSAGLKYFRRRDYVRARERLVYALHIHKGELEAYPYLALTLAPAVLVPPARLLVQSARRLSTIVSATARRTAKPKQRRREPRRFSNDERPG